MQGPPGPGPAGPPMRGPPPGKLFSAHVYNTFHMQSCLNVGQNAGFRKFLSLTGELSKILTHITRSGNRTVVMFFQALSTNLPKLYF